MRALKFAVGSVAFILGVIATIACALVDSRVAMAAFVIASWWSLSLLIPQKSRPALRRRLFWINLYSMGVVLGTTVSFLAVSAVESCILGGHASWLFTSVSAWTAVVAIFILASLEEGPPPPRRHPEPRGGHIYNKMPRLLPPPPHKR